MKEHILAAIDIILSKGTKIVSFTYGGKPRNVLVGANEIASVSPRWGMQLNRALRIHKGKTFLVARVQNDSESPIKCFDLDKIENFSAFTPV